MPYPHVPVGRAAPSYPMHSIAYSKNWSMQTEAGSKDCFCLVNSTGPNVDFIIAQSVVQYNN